MNTLRKTTFGPICFLCYADITPLITNCIGVDLHLKTHVVAEQTVDVTFKNPEDLIIVL